MKYQINDKVKHPGLAKPTKIIKVLDESRVILEGVPGVTTTDGLSKVTSKQNDAATSTAGKPPGTTE